MTEKKERKKRNIPPYKYDKSIITKMIKFFDVKPYEIKKVQRFTKSGESYEIDEKFANDLPTINAFAASVNLTAATLINWSKNESLPEFMHVYQICREKQETHLLQNGLHGNYNASMCIFALKNICKWTDGTLDQDKLPKGVKLIISND